MMIECLLEEELFVLHLRFVQSKQEQIVPFSEEDELLWLAIEQF
jgi:hypothetical protein